MDSYFYVKSKDRVYKVKADYLKYESKDTGDVITLKKEYEDKINPESGDCAWDVAVIKVSDDTLVCLEDNICRDEIPSTKRAIVFDVLKLTCSFVVGYFIFRKLRIS